MKARSTERLAVLGVLALLGSQVQAGLLPACTQAEVDMQAEELQIDGDFRWCYRPSVWLGQTDGSYENLGMPLDRSHDFVVVDLTDATVVAGTTRKVVVKCFQRPRCQIDVAVGYPAPVARTG